MIKVYRLTKRHIDGPKSGSAQCDQIKLFITPAGHGVGTIDFSEQIAEIEDIQYEQIVHNGDKYLKFKLGNIDKFDEIEIFPEHAIKLLPHMIQCPLKVILEDLKEGYLVLRKDF